VTAKLVVATVIAPEPIGVDDQLLNPNHLQPWLNRWWPVARPLLWSHAMYLIALSAASQS
jgi:hypothetical protein